ncbi:hypothetical protein [uncultured Clostridium sp.]|uniref:hypothetical protein n=1 Tax=uncultured Clostridium sp. TaxID=59620 RepID=UPI0032163C1E
MSLIETIHNNYKKYKCVDCKNLIIESSACCMCDCDRSKYCYIEQLPKCNDACINYVKGKPQFYIE